MVWNSAGHQSSTSRICVDYTNVPQISDASRLERPGGGPGDAPAGGMLSVKLRVAFGSGCSCGMQTDRQGTEEVLLAFFCEWILTISAWILLESCYRETLLFTPPGLELCHLFPQWHLGVCGSHPACVPFLHGWGWGDLAFVEGKIPQSVCFLFDENADTWFADSVLWNFRVFLFLFKESALTFGEGNDTPLQYSCLENPMYGGAW